MKAETRIDNIHQTLQKTKKPRLVFLDDTGIVRSIPYREVVGIYDYRAEIRHIQDDLDHVLNGDAK